MYRFSSAFDNPRSSPIRELFKHLDDPDMISFAGGYPDAQLFDVEGLDDAARRAYSDSTSCLQYGNTDGIEKLKTQIQLLMAARSVVAEPGNIVVTTGSQQAFDLLLRVFVEPGDIVYFENPTYLTNMQAARIYGAQIRPVPTDGGGLDVEQLEAMLLDGGDAGRPKLLYTVPTFGNPTGVSMTVAQRRRLLELAVEHRFVVVEDDPYADLRFSGVPVPSLLALAKEVEGASDWVVHMASLSKTVAPGLRVAWSIAPVEIARRCSVAKQSADIGSSPWVQSIAAEYLESGRLEPHLDRIRNVYGQKCRALCDALRMTMKDAISFQEPEGGLFVWAKLEWEVSSTDLLDASIARKTMFVPGGGFYVANPDPSTLRLSFAAPSVARIQEGVERLSRAWEAVGARVGVVSA